MRAGSSGVPGGKGVASSGNAGWTGGPTGSSKFMARYDEMGNGTASECTMDPFAANRTSRRLGVLRRAAEARQAPEDP
jgi:hypothetical protein